MQIVDFLPDVNSGAAYLHLTFRVMLLFKFRSEYMVPFFLSNDTYS